MLKAAFTLGALARCPSMVLAGNQYEHTFFSSTMLEFRHGAGDLYKKAQKWAPCSCEQTVFVSSGIVHCFVLAAKFMIQNSV